MKGGRTEDEMGREEGGRRMHLEMKESYPFVPWSMSPGCVVRMKFTLFRCLFKTCSTHSHLQCLLKQHSLLHVVYASGAKLCFLGSNTKILVSGSPLHLLSFFLCVWQCLGHLSWGLICMSIHLPQLSHHSQILVPFKIQNTLELFLLCLPLFLVTFPTYYVLLTQVSCPSERISGTNDMYVLCRINYLLALKG